MSRRGARVERLELAHALRTPLTSAALAAGLLDGGSLGLLNEAQREAIASIVSALDRLRALVEAGLRTEALGAYAGPIERRRVALDAIAAAAIEPFGAQARALGVEISLEAEPTVVDGDPLELRWVVASLVGNALRYADGRIAVAVRRAHATATVTVEDDGPGIDPDVARRLFERDGRGVTLCLVREIVEAHGGGIDVSRRKNGGTRFVVRVPEAPEPTPHEPRREP